MTATRLTHDAAALGAGREALPTVAEALRGTVWWVQLEDHEEPKPYIIVSNNRRNKGLDTVLAVRVTTTNRHSHLPTVVELPANERVYGWVKCDQITEIWHDELDRYEGGLSKRAMAVVEDGLSHALGIGQ